MLAPETDEKAVARGKRLAQARVAAGFRSARAAAMQHGWSPSSFAQHESGARGMSQMVDAYAAAFGVSVGWLMNGEDGAPVHKPIVTQQKSTAVAPANTGAAMVPAYGGSDAMPFSNTLLDRLGVSPSTVAFLDIDGGNESPEYKSGDTLLIDTADQDTTRPGAFAVRAGPNRVAVLRLQFMVGTEPPRVHVSVLGDHPHSYDVPLNTLPVIGRVRWYGRII